VTRIRLYINNGNKKKQKVIFDCTDFINEIFSHFKGFFSLLKNFSQSDSSFGSVSRCTELAAFRRVDCPFERALSVDRRKEKLLSEKNVKRKNNE